SPRRGRKVGTGAAGHVGVASGVHGDPVAVPALAAAQVRGVDQSSAACIELRHEGGAGSARAGLESPRRGRKVGGVGRPRHVSIAVGVYGNPAPAFATDASAAAGARAAEVRGVNERGTRRIELRYEGVGDTTEDG